MDVGQLETVELGRLSMRDWAQLGGPEPAAFGAVMSAMEWRAKDVHVGVRDAEGSLVAAVGASVASVTVDGHGPFEVVGVGALIVHRDHRGSGLGRTVIDLIVELLPSLGPDRAMIFCERSMQPLYASLGYAPIAAPVWVDQSTGPMRMPLVSMWNALRPTLWPEGTVRVHGLPF